jgi:hypothetical protein
MRVRHSNGVVQLGKCLVVLGIALALIGAAIWSGVGRGWFGRLPGDVHITKENFSFHFPIVTCLLISAAITLLMWLIRK